MASDTEPKHGRPTAYFPELGQAICELLAEGMTLKAICRMDQIAVAESTVRSWAVNPEHPFSEVIAETVHRELLKLTLRFKSDLEAYAQACLTIRGKDKIAALAAV